MSREAQRKLLRQQERGDPGATSRVLAVNLLSMVFQLPRAAPSITFARFLATLLISLLPDLVCFHSGTLSSSLGLQFPQ